MWNPMSLAFVGMVRSLKRSHGSHFCEVSLAFPHVYTLTFKALQHTWPSLHMTSFSLNKKNTNGFCLHKAHSAHHNRQCSSWQRFHQNDGFLSVEMS